MSYIEDKITIKEYLDNIQDKGKNNHIKSILNQFDIFCKQKYNKSNQEIMDDLFEMQETQRKDKIYRIFNQFKDWMLIDHPELEYFLGRNKNQKRTIKKRHSNTIKTYLKTIRAIFEEIGNIEINSRILAKRVKIPKAEEEEPETFTKQQMRTLLDRCSNQAKLKYMVLKDTGCRIGELVQIRKRDVDLSQKRITVKIQAKYTKTRKARTVFITKETEPMFRILLNHKKDAELMFGTSEEVYSAKGSEKAHFTYYRNELTKDYPEFGERYQSNNRHKKTVHSIRSFTATQCTRAIDESWGHGYTGHKKYLDQYIRDKDDYLEKFIRSENYLMIYETIEVVDSDERVAKLEAQNKEIFENFKRYDEIVSQTKIIEEENRKKDEEIKRLQLIIDG
jgi:integrase